MSDFKVVSLLNPAVMILTGGVALGAGTQTQTSGTVVFSNSNGVSFGLSNGTMTASAAGGGGAGDGYNILAAGSQTANTTGTVLFSNGGGVTFGMNNSSQITATVATNYMASNQSSNFVQTSQSSLFQQTSATSAITSNAMNTSVSSGFAGTGFTSTTTAGTAVVATQGTNGLSMGIPQFLTTFNQTVDTNKAGTGFTSTTTAGVVPTGTLNTNGFSMAVPNWITTYAAQTTQTQASGNIAGVGTTFGGTNVSGSMTLNSNGLALSLSAPTPGGGAAINFSAGVASGNLQTVVFSNANGVSFGLNGSTITASVAGGAGDGNNVLGVNGVATSATTTYILSNSNNVSFGLNAGTITATATFAQSVQTQAAGNIAGTGYTSTTQAGSTVGMTQNTAGLSAAWPPFLTTFAAQTVDTNKAGTGFTSTTTAGVVPTGTLNTNGFSLAVPNWITTYAAQTTQTQASGNIAGAGYTSTTQAGSTVGATHNSAGLSMAWPPFITTATQSVQTQASGNIVGSGFTSTTVAGSVPSATLNSAGLSMGLPQWITTFAAQTNQTVASGNIAGVGTTFAGTNASASMTLNSVGLNFALSVAGGGVINQTGPNIAVAGQTITAGTVYFSNSPTVTFGMDGASNITASAAGGGGGAAATIGGYEIFPPLGGNTAFSTGGLGTIYVQKFIAPVNVSFNNFERRYSGSSASSSISAQAAHTISYGLYSLGSGASTSIYNLIASSSMFMQASYSSNLSAGLTVQQGATSFTASSAGTVGQSALTGFKHFYMPFTSTITAGGNYAFAQVMSSATTGATAPLRVGFQELSVINNLTIGKIFNSTVVASNASFVGDWAQGVYSSSSNGLPSTLAISGLTNAVSQQRMYLQLDA